MHPIAFLQPDLPELDTIIVWQDAERLVAFGYQNGQVVSSRPCESGDIGEATAEIEQAFGVSAPVVQIPQASDASGPRRWH